MLLLINSKIYANHILGADLSYAWVSGNTYNITLVIYADCASPETPSLDTSKPKICIFNSGAFVTSINLTVVSPATGTNVTPVCLADTGLTTCSGGTIPGIKKFIYRGSYTVSGPSAAWQFAFLGYMNSTVYAGWSTRLTNIVVTPSPPIIALIDTLNNTGSFTNNSSPVLATDPTAYFCLNEPDNYNPNATDPNGDSVVFALTAAEKGNTTPTCTIPGATVTYNSPYTGATPIATSAFSFNSASGQISFTPNLLGRFLVSYNIRKFRSGTLIGTSQRQMTFFDTTCIVLPPWGAIVSGSGGGITDTTHYAMCQGTGSFSFDIDGKDQISTNLIKVSVSGLPSWATAIVTGDSTTTPVITVSGSVSGVAPGAYNFYVTYKDNNCPISGVNTVQYTITVNANPSLSGNVPICVLSTMTLTPTVSGGTWVSGTTAVATVGVSSGIVLGVAQGTSIITYSYSAANCSATAVVTVNPLPNTISGTPLVCVGSNVTISDITSGGTWISHSPAVATIGALTGVIGGVSAGNSVITYQMTATGCFVETLATVNPVPADISGTAVVCAGACSSLSDATSGGIWSSSNAAVAVVGTSGIACGVSAGTTTITYMLGTGCYKTKVFTVNPVPAAITGPTGVCVGSTINLTDASAGGTWSSSATSVATVGTGGTVGGVSLGTSIITYAFATGCSQTATVTVNTTPVPVTGTFTVCAGSTQQLSDATSGGLWGSTNTSVATVNSSGNVTGVAAGTTTITYSLGSGCLVNAVMTVDPTPAAITGSSTVCVGFTTVLSDISAGGAWSSSNSSVATASGGTVGGVAAGTAIITYAFATGCNQVFVMTVNPVPTAILGTTNVCVGAATVLSDAVGGGVWSSSNSGVATASGGTIGGVAAGSATITYSLGTGCYATAPVTVNPNPAAITPSGVNICMGSTASLTDATGGGAWSSGSSLIATVSAGTIGGVAAGTAVISYTLGTGCYATTTITVNLTPVAISPAAAAVCVGNTVSFSDVSGGGAWSSSNGAIATINAGTGAAGGVAAGSVTITYSIGTCYTTAALTVNANPAAITPAAAVSICVGATASLTDASAGGAWSSSNITIATVNASGVVTGVGAGVANISYTNSSGCWVIKPITVNVTPTAITPSSTLVCQGATVNLTDAVIGGAWTSSNTAVATIGPTGVTGGVTGGSAVITYTIGSCNATATVTVTPLPGAGSVSGPSNLCAGATGSYTDVVGGGLWTTSNIAIATIGAGTGIATAVSAGTVTISYSVSNSCGTSVATMVVSVTPTGAGTITAPSTICAGTFIILGESIGGGTWSLANGNATVTGTGLLTGVAVGTDIITYSVTDICGTSSTTQPITIGPFLTAGTISGSSFVCVGSTATLSDVAPGGVWSSSNTALSTVGAGTGIVSGVAGGVDTIYYTVTASCGVATASQVMTVTPMPNAGGISGSAIICAGSALLYTESVSGGTWSVASSDATITGTGLLTAISPGTNTISYTVTNACGTAVATKTISIGAFLTAGSISGAATVCQGTTITLSDVVSGGVWSSASTATATVGTGGVVTGVAGGTTTITYTVTSACGSVSATHTITVNPLPDAGTISGPPTLCLGSSSLFTDAASGGVWSIAGPSATITGGGMVTPVATGTNIISYTVVNTCGTAIATQTVTIDVAPSASVISGGSNVCIGTSLTLTDVTGGGVWNSSNATATVSGTGLVTGVTPGIDTISYTIGNACGTSVATHTITVSPAAFAGTITGPSVVCSGTFAVFTDAAGGGAWTSSNASATITSAGILTGVTPGIDTISYTVINTCGVAIATKTVTIGTSVSAGTISGPASVCAGATITLTDAVSGGVWSSSNSSANVGSGSGIVTGITAGVDTIYYSVSGSCGTTSAMSVITVVPLPSAATISGPASLCNAATVSLTDVVSGGVWSSSNPSVATVDASGNVTGMAPGSSVISYSVTNSCGTATATQTEIVNPLPTVMAITGTTHECIGSTVTLSDATTGGVWSSSSTAVAVVGSSSGAVTGLSAGTASVNYTVTNTFGCSLTVSATDTVQSSAAIAAITGATSQCVGATTTFSDAAPGGVWSSSNPAIASIDAATGAATGIASGSVTIMYTVSGSGCPAVASVGDTVNAVPALSPITGTTSVCVGSTTTLSNTVSGGVWSSSAPTVASIGASAGLVSGLAAGTSVVSYSVSNACGAAISTATVSVHPLPSAGTITATFSNGCIGSSISLTDAATGGVWSSSNTAVAAVGSTGVVTGIASGTATIRYTVTNSFGCSNVASVNISVGGSLPGAAVNPAGSATLCHGNPVTLHITSSGSGLTYQWMHNGSVIPGATTSSYTTYTTGYFSAIVSNGSCSESATGTTVVAPPNAVITFTPPDVLSTGLYSAYQWFLNGIAIAGAHSSYINLAGTGTYEVVVTDANGCVDTSAPYIITSGTGGGNTGVNSIQLANNVKVYPNPATSVLHIDAPVKVNVAILSIDGKLLLQQKDADAIDVSKLANGLYIVMVYGQDNMLIKTAKFAKTE